MSNNNLDYLEKYLDKDKLEEGKLLLDKGISPQYIVGNVDFYGNIINVDNRVLIPRFETELLVEKTVSYINKLFDKKVKILDMGTGSGCIAISLKKLVDCDMSASDVSSDALDVAMENASNNNVDIKFINSNIFSNINDKFDCLISNPPYISYDEEIEDVVKDNEPHLALYAKEDGMYFYKNILEQASNYLEDKFLIAFEIGYTQGNKVSDLAYKYLGENINVSVEKDYSDKDRFVFIWNV